VGVVDVCVCVCVCVYVYLCVWSGLHVWRCGENVKESSVCGVEWVVVRVWCVEAVERQGERWAAIPLIIFGELNCWVV